jgi:hypothetical protein
MLTTGQPVLRFQAVAGVGEAELRNVTAGAGVVLAKGHDRVEEQVPSEVRQLGVDPPPQTYLEPQLDPAREAVRGKEPRELRIERGLPPAALAGRERRGGNRSGSGCVPRPWMRRVRARGPQRRGRFAHPGANDQAAFRCGARRRN